MEHCSAQTKECPEVLDYLQLKHSKTCPEFLSSVEFRNTLKGCLTRAQNNRSKTFVFINELCTVLKQHRDKRRVTLSKAAPSTSTSASVQSTSVPPNSEKRSDEEQPSTSGVQEENKEQDQKEEKRAKRASRKQVGTDNKPKKKSVSVNPVPVLFLKSDDARLNIWSTFLPLRSRTWRIS